MTLYQLINNKNLQIKTVIITGGEGLDLTNTNKITCTPWIGTHLHNDNYETIDPNIISATLINEKQINISIENTAFLPEYHCIKLIDYKDGEIKMIPYDNEYQQVSVIHGILSIDFIIKRK